MKITKTQLKQIIKEELGRVLRESSGEFEDFGTNTGSHSKSLDQRQQTERDAATRLTQVAREVASAAPDAVSKLMQQDSVLSVSVDSVGGAHNDAKSERSIENARSFLVRSLQKTNPDLAVALDKALNQATQFGHRPGPLLHYLARGLAG